MKAIVSLLIVLLALVVSIVPAQAGFLDSLGFGKSATNSTASTALGSLSQDQMIGGLKDALAKACNRRSASSVTTVAFSRTSR